MPAGTFKLDDREFKRTLARYREFSRRDTVEIVNTKAFYISRAAIAFTPRADSGKVRAFFDRGTQKIVGMIINARRGKRGEKGLYGDAMQLAQIQLKRARLRSISFLKSGWLPAVQALARLTKYRRGVKRSEEGQATGKVAQTGRPKGRVQPAISAGIVTRAIIINSAGDNKDNKGALERLGGPALQRAINAETASMKEYIEGKMKSCAHAAGIKTN